MNEITKPCLKVRNVNKAFGNKIVLRNVSLDVYPGEVLGFLGPNGAGKTTLIKIIMGFLYANSGEVEICGFNVKKDYEKAMAQIGGIVENPEMYTTLSGRLNLEMYARLHDNVPKERIDEVVKIVGMENRINDKIKKYSLGMKQRIGVAQALLHRPKILILDEPTNGLDPQGIKALRDILKHLAHEENVAVLVSSHMLSEMELMCDRVCIIQNGVVLGSQKIGELVASTEGNYYKILSHMGKELFDHFTEKGTEISDHTDEYVIVKATDEEISPLLLEILQKGITVTGVHKIEGTLEDAFIEMTKGGGQIA